MKWDSDLVRRAVLVVDSLAFEIVDSVEYGMKIVLVTNCLDQNQKAIFIPDKKNPFEKLSSFLDDNYIDTVRRNWSLIMEEFYE